jgi:hypothetical protein
MGFPRRLLPTLILVLAAACPTSVAAAASVHGDDPAHDRQIDIAVPASTVSAQERAAERIDAQTDAAFAQRSLAVILVNFTNDQSQPFTTDQARSAYFTGANSVNAYYAEQSEGSTTFTGRVRSDGDVFGYYTIPSTNAGCNWQTWGNQARAAAKADGHDTAAYDHVAVVFPDAQSCGWSGLGYEPGRYTYLNGTIGLSTTAHEIGHNLGLLHASAYRCTSGGTRVIIGGTCDISEYGDPFDVMGSGARSVSGYHRAQAGWLGSGTTRTVTTAGDYLLSALLPTGGGDKVLRIPRGDGSDYSLDFRQPFGSIFDTFGLGDPIVNGVGIRVTPGPAQALDNPLLLDANPATSTFTDAALNVGSTFTDATRSISITTLAASPAGATVRVSFTPTGPTGTTTTSGTSGTTTTSGTTGTTTSGTTGTTTGTTTTTSGTNGTTTGTTTTTSGSTGTTTTTSGSTGTTTTSGTTGSTPPPPPPPTVTVVSLRCNRAGTTCTLVLHPCPGATVLSAALVAAQRNRVRAYRARARQAGGAVTMTLAPRPALRRGGRYSLSIRLRGSGGSVVTVVRSIRTR